MKIVFVSNYYNHHQAPFSEYMDSLTNHNFNFIATSFMSDSRKKMGWGGIDLPPFVLQYQFMPKECDKLIDEADAVIFGSAPHTVIKQRLSQGKLTFLYSERIHTADYNYLKLIKHFPTMFWKYGRYKNFYLLCASAYSSFDYAKTLTFLGKAYKWGYFPATKQCENLQERINMKRSDKISILYVSRLIKLKHPEMPLRVAAQLKKDGIPFRLTMIGTGPLKDQIHAVVNNLGLKDDVILIDALSPEQVREQMDKANIFLFTSDSNEGWGAVMNESMNSACAVVASSEIGSVPFLIEDGKNGYIYQGGNFDDFYQKVKTLCMDREKREQMGMSAYQTISTEWNAETAARRLLALVDDIQKTKKSKRFSTGPCSKAEIVKDGWYK